MKLLDPIWWKGLDRLLILGRRSHGWDWLVMSRIGDVVKAENSGNADDLQFLNEPELKDLPIVLVPLAEQIVSKQISIDHASDPASAVLGIEVGDSDDFLIEVVAVSEKESFVSLSRKDQIDKLLDELDQEIKDRLIDINLSPLGFLSVLSAITSEAETGNFSLEISGQTFHLQNGLLDQTAGSESISFSSHEVAENFSVNTSHIDLFFAAIRTWEKDALKSYPVHPEINKTSSEQKLVAALKKATVIAACFVLITSLGLAGYRAILSGKKAALQSQYSSNLPAIENLESLKKVVSELETLSDDLSSKTLRPSKSSWIFDQIAALLQPGLSLEKISFHPSEEELKKLRLETQRNFNLIIKGKSKNSSSVAAFSSELEAQPFIQAIDVKESGFEYQSGEFGFLFLLEVKDAG